jgi:hypothetical protein
MPDRASVFQGVQIGVEVTEATAVAANKKLSSLRIEPEIKAEPKIYSAMGEKAARVQALGKEWGEAKLSGACTYDELAYPLSSLLGYAAPVLRATTTSVYDWTFPMSYNSADTRKTFTVEQGSADVDGTYKMAHKFAGAFLTEGGIAFSRDAVEFSGTMMGRRVTDDITMTATPTLVPLVPVVPNQVDVYYADTQAGLDAASALARVLTVDWNMSDRLSPIWALNSSETSFSGTVEKYPKNQLTVKMEANAEGMALLTNLREGTKKFWRILCTGPEIETGFNYTFQIDFSGVVSNISPFSDEDGLYAITWTFDATIDSTWDNFMEVTLTNSISAL